MMSNYKVVSLFCGCGGMDLGFTGGFSYLRKNYKNNPIDIVFANDIEKNACNTYNYNFNHNAICEDISNIEVESIPDCDIVIGGFPCQDFSLAGKRKGFDSTRGLLYKQMLRVIKEKQPLVFVAENVEGLTLKINGESPLLKIIDEFENVGYKVKYKLFNTAYYEVPEMRKRVIIVGVRNDISEEYEYPKEIMNENNWLTAKDAIDDLWDKLGKNEVPNHSEKDYSKAKFNPNGKGQGNRLLDANKPSVTIRAEHHGNIEGHYRTYNEENSKDVKNWRRLTVRECARIQSFPDNFVFPGAASAAYKQIGNAVPPVFAWHICNSVIGFLDKPKNK